MTATKKGKSGMCDVFSDDFLLHSTFARKLYSRISRLPIIDYHGHLRVDLLASNEPFKNLTDIWIRGDHYKWRLMRLNGVPERYCSGDASDEEKFEAWARTLPFAIRNPIFHWSCRELLHYFGIDSELTPENAWTIWGKANELLKTEALRPRGILSLMNVEILCTTDDPADDLCHHIALRNDSSFGVRVYPTYRPDAALHLNDSASFCVWVMRLSKAADIYIHDLTSFIEALRQRHGAFHAVGCRISDHGLERAYAEPCSQAEATKLFSQMLCSKTPSTAALDQWRGYLMRQFAEWNHERGWVMMLHLGALRNNNTRMFTRIGIDTGCDSIGDFSHAWAVNRFLDALDATGHLPKTILFNSNPCDNLLFATIAANFFEDGVAGKVQYGPAWWFLDTAPGIRQHFNALSFVGLSHQFVGMVADSRSFFSLSRHDYFRRVLCDLYAEDVALGVLPANESRLAGELEAIFYRNARKYFNWETVC